jgi:hypothetical protein
MSGWISLKYWVEDIDDPARCLMFETLLDSTIGDSRYLRVDWKAKGRWQYCFWATDKEYEMLKTLISREEDKILDQEYSLLVDTLT